jgi:hypothetical protein
MSTLAWRARDDAPAPGGLVATGAGAHALVRALACRDAAELAGLTVVPVRDVLVVLGPAERLPWIDGVRYCAQAADAPGLWLPTTTAPDLPADLVLAALQRRTGQSALLLWTAPELVLPLDDAIPVDAAVLAWLDRELD